MNDYEQCQEPGIGPKGLAILLASSLAGQLETLRLGGQKLYEKGVRALVLSDKLSALRRLGIEGDHVSAREMRSLVYGGPLSATLEELSLSGYRQARRGGSTGGPGDMKEDENGAGGNQTSRPSHGRASPLG